MRHAHRARRVLVVAASVLVAVLALMVGAEAKRARKAKPAPAPSVDCKTDADCVVVPDDCCACEQGGKQRAISRKQKDTYEKDRKKRCAKTECIEMMSQDPSCTQHALCGAGICELGG
jgi:hypothetical protein